MLDSLQTLCVHANDQTVCVLDVGGAQKYQHQAWNTAAEHAGRDRIHCWSLRCNEFHFISWIIAKLLLKCLFETSSYYTVARSICEPSSENISHKAESDSCFMFYRQLSSLVMCCLH